MTKHLTRLAFAHHLTPFNAIMKLSDAMLKLKPREEAGSKTARKYAFQKDLSLFILMEKHFLLKDYVFLFDLHDDLLILDSSSEPSQIDFYQIKSKDGNGNWTINSLVQKKEFSLSILGKLYNNKIVFDKYVKSLNFISNARFSFKKLKDGADSKSVDFIPCKNMDDEDILLCNDKIQQEHDLATKPEFEKISNFETTILHNIDSSTHCIGKLNKLINDINPENKINPELAYHQILNEITIKTSNTISGISLRDFEHLIREKGISKALFESYLERAGLYMSVEEEWDEIYIALQKSEVGYMELKKFKNAWREMTGVLIKDYNKIPLQSIIREVVEVIDRCVKDSTISTSMTLNEIVTVCYAQVNPGHFSEYFVKCLIIKKFNEQ